MDDKGLYINIYLKSIINCLNIASNCYYKKNKGEKKITIPLTICKFSYFYMLQKKIFFILLN